MIMFLTKERPRKTSSWVDRPLNGWERQVAGIFSLSEGVMKIELDIDHANGQVLSGDGPGF